MSQVASEATPSLEAIREGYEAFNRGDYEAWIDLYDEDVEFHDLAETPDTAVFRGHAGVRAWLAKLQEAWREGFRFEPRSVTKGDGVIIVETRAKGIGVGSGVPIEMTFYAVMRYRDQKVVWSQGFIDRAEALEAAGLRE